MRLFYDNNNEEANVVESIAIKCRNFLRINGLYLRYKTFQEIITQFLVNTVLHHVGFLV